MFGLFIIALISIIINIYLFIKILHFITNNKNLINENNYYLIELNKLRNRINQLKKFKN